MKQLVENAKYLNLIAVITLLVSFALALLWGVAKAIYAWSTIIMTAGQSSTISLLLIKLIDAFLIATVLYLLAASIYKLFIGDLDVPYRMVARNLPELKSKLSSLIVLVIAVRFVEALFEDTPAMDVLWLAIATALVDGALIAFGYLSSKNEKGEEPVETADVPLGK